MRPHFCICSQLVIFGSLYNEVGASKRVFIKTTRSTVASLQAVPIKMAAVQKNETANVGEPKLGGELIPEPGTEVPDFNVEIDGGGYMHEPEPVSFIILTWVVGWMGLIFFMVYSTYVY